MTRTPAGRPGCRRGARRREPEARSDDQRVAVVEGVAQQGGHGAGRASRPVGRTTRTSQAAPMPRPTAAARRRRPRRWWSSDAQCDGDGQDAGREHGHRKQERPTAGARSDIGRIARIGRSSGRLGWVVSNRHHCHRRPAAGRVEALPRAGRRRDGRRPGRWRRADRGAPRVAGRLHGDRRRGHPAQEAPVRHHVRGRGRRRSRRGASARLHRDPRRAPRQRRGRAGGAPQIDRAVGDDVLPGKRDAVRRRARSSIATGWSTRGVADGGRGGPRPGGASRSA